MTPSEKSSLDDPELFEKAVSADGIGYRSKKYPGPIAIDKMLSQPDPDWKLPKMPVSKAEGNASLT